MAATLPALETVALSRGATNGAELRITLNRPDRMNAWDAQLSRDLLVAVELAGADADVRAVTLTGAGRAFCSGADLKAGFDTTPAGDPDLHGALRERYHPIITGLRRLPKPVLAAVNGPAVGIGCSLALACDLVVASESAYLTLAFANIGLVPDGGSSLLIPARVGLTRASELALLGERVDAVQARDWGLINRVLADGDFASGVAALAERLATGPTRSYAASKAALNQSLLADLDAQLEVEAGLQQQLAASSDFHAGVAGFLARRQPRFTGE